MKLGVGAWFSDMHTPPLVRIKNLKTFLRAKITRSEKEKTTRSGRAQRHRSCEGELSKTHDMLLWRVQIEPSEQKLIAPKWWAAVLTSIVRAAVLALTKALWGLNVLYILLPCEIQVEYEHPLLWGIICIGHVLHRIHCNNVSPNHVYLIVNISVISLL